MDVILEYLQTYAIFNVAVICWAIGYIIKHYINFIPNKYIPLILAGIGLLLNVAFNQWQFNVEILLTGLGSGLVATGSFEAVRNLYEKKIDKNTEEGGQNE